MQASRFLAQLIGPTFLVIGLGIPANRHGYRAMVHEFLQSRTLIYLAGLLALVPGIAIVLAHNVWVLDWRLIITIFGWLAVIGGVARVLFPQNVMAIGERWSPASGTCSAAASLCSSLARSSPSTATSRRVIADGSLTELIGLDPAGRLEQALAAHGLNGFHTSKKLNHCVGCSRTISSSTPTHWRAASASSPRSTLTGGAMRMA